MAKIHLWEDAIRFSPEIVSRGVSNTSVSINEDSNAKVSGLMTVRGVFQRYDCVNANGRMYPKDLWDKTLKDPSVLESLSSKGMLGHLEHPESGKTRLDRIPSHVVTKIWDDNKGNIMGEAVILNTSTGRDVAALFEAGCSVGISSRADGEVEMRENIQHVKSDGFTLITWDLVNDNSVPGARPVQVRESVNEVRSSNSLLNFRVGQPVIADVGFEGDGVTVEEGDAGEVVEFSPHRDLFDGPAINVKLNGKTFWAAARLFKTNSSIRTESISTNQSKLGESNMSKIGDMRRLDLAVSQLVKSGFKNMGLNHRVAMQESLMEFKSKAQSMALEDKTVASYGAKVVKMIEDAEGELDAAPEATDGAISEPCFVDVLTKVVKELSPAADTNKVTDAVGKMYQKFLDNVPLDIQATVDTLNQSENKEDEGVEHVDTDVGTPITDQLESALKIIKVLSETDSSSNLQEVQKQLTEAKAKVARYDDLKRRFDRNLNLLRESADYIEKSDEKLEISTKELTELKDTLEAAVALLKKNGINSADELLDEGDSATKPATAKKDDKVDNKDDKGDPKKKFQHRFAKKEDEKKAVTESKKEVITESKDSEPHEFVRMMGRLRTGAYNQS